LKTERESRWYTLFFWSSEKKNVFYAVVTDVGGSAGTWLAAADLHASSEGLKLVHLSARRERFLRDRLGGFGGFQ
jgi:hypothetical protein